MNIIKQKGERYKMKWLKRILNYKISIPYNKKRLVNKVCEELKVKKE